jgi:hypothetical protein
MIDQHRSGNHLCWNSIYVVPLQTLHIGTGFFQSVMGFTVRPHVSMSLNWELSCKREYLTRTIVLQLESTTSTSTCSTRLDRSLLKSNAGLRDSDSSEPLIFSKARSSSIANLPLEINLYGRFNWDCKGFESAWYPNWIFSVSNSTVKCTSTTGVSLFWPHFCWTGTVTVLMVPTSVRPGSTLRGYY